MEGAEDEHSFRGLIDKFLRPLQHLEDDGMGNHIEGYLIAHVNRVACGVCIVHADGAFGPLHLKAQVGTQEVAGAGDNHTLVAS